jgi:hypothetical protein
MDVQVIIRNRWVQTAAISAVSTAIGTGLGYLLGRRNGKKSIQKAIYESVELAMEEMKPKNFALRFEHLGVEPIIRAEDVVAIIEPEASLKGMMRAQLAEDEPEEVIIIEPDEEVVDFAEEDDPANKKSDGDDTEEETAPLRVNVFTIDDGSWDYEAELSTRNDVEPYVIHIDEFKDDEMGFHQETVTYYSGDQMMGDSRDKPIYGYHKIMGELKFGHGSGDKNVVYIRNEKMRMEWEVLLHTGKYAHEVEGFSVERDDEELKHSVPKMRRE